MSIEADIKRNLKKIKQNQWDNLLSLSGNIQFKVSPQLNFYKIEQVLIDSTNDHDIKRQIIEDIYENELVFPFDWVNWQEGLLFIENDCKNYEEKELIFLVKLITTHVRKDRFCEGWFDEVLNNKTIFYILTAIRNKI